MTLIVMPFLQLSEIKTETRLEASGSNPQSSSVLSHLLTAQMTSLYESVRTEKNEAAE